MATQKSRKNKAKASAKPALAGKREEATQSAGEWFERLVALQARLRAPKGCPWDIEQTHLTLRTYLIEEAYEVLEALESGDDTKFAEELGDLLLQVVFHAQIAAEERRFTAADVVREVHQKMVRRHPHVFGEKTARNAGEVLKNWEQIKAEERRAKSPAKGVGEAASEGQDASLLDGIPHTLPAVMQGFQLTRRASRIGFDWDHVEGVIEKLQEELEELRRAREGHSTKHVEEEIGDVLFAAVNLARFLKVDPEIALKRTNTKFATRFREMERRARQSGRALADVPRSEMEELWDEAKASERVALSAPPGRKAAAKR
ncbi:MAG TPA: nucleoside triphosphate pyrophosphohydrolase [Candidatus Acidoferrum sp.]|nr:nucleoside triphosphate pyrophosphohydrolase [Candidatus Acidoferrum sp.]